MDNELLNETNKIKCRYKMNPGKRREILMQVTLGIIANLVSIAPGMNVGFSAVALPSLQDENATFHVKVEEASWIASIASISTPFGCIITGSMLEKFGRKFTLMAANFPSLLGWLLIAFARGKPTLIMIYVGRCFTGLATGMSAVPATVYSTEMATDSLRGMFITWNSISMSLGILFVYIFGYIFQDNWRAVAGTSAIFPALALVLVYVFLPESPSWLLSKGRSVESEDSMKTMRGIPKKSVMPLSVANEFAVLSQKYKRKPNEKGNDSSQKKNIIQQFFKMGTIKPFIIMNFFFFFQQFSGIFVLIYYAVSVVVESGVTWDPYVVTILIGACRFFVSIFMSFICKRYGRRPLSIISGAGMTICMACLATYLYLISTDKIAKETVAMLTWIPATSLILYIILSTIGFLTLPWAMIGEVYPADVRGLAAGLTTCSAYIFNFIIVKVYPDMIFTLHDYGLFFFYGSFALIGTIFVVVFLPETQGKTLLEIEEYFTKKKSKEPNISTIELSNVEGDK